MSVWVKILTDKDVRFSEQDLLACSGGSCEQGNTIEALFAGMKRGVALAECLPYQERTTFCGEGRCPDWHVGAWKIKSATKINSKEELIEALKNGPVMATMAVPQSFTVYKGGIYTGQLPYDPILGYHLVDIHGFDTNNDTILLSNHWRNWGFRIDATHDSYGNITWNADGCELTYYKIVMSPEPVEPDPEPVPGCKYSAWFWRRGRSGRAVVHLWRKLKRAVYNIVTLGHIEGRW